MDIEVFFEEGMKVNARVGNHVVKTDQKPYGGGQDSAPAPFDYFLTSLGTCAGIFVKIFCEKRGIDTAGIKILQKHVVDQQTRKLTNINMEIVLPDDFPEKYKSAVISAANQCSVKRLLADPPEIGVTTI